jgi:sialate O-acetylesterase
MQVHNGAARQTVFAINNWKAAAGADLGIGNSTGKTLDWTFTGNAHTYTVKRLRVLVRPAR